MALRDTELLRISPDGFEALIARHPRVMMNLMQMLVKRLQDANRGRSAKARPKTFAIVPLQEGLSEVPIAHRLAQALARDGQARRRAGRLRRRADARNGSTAFEQAHDVVFYRGDAPDSAWTHLCLRQADRIFLLARADQPLPLRAARPARLQGARVGGLPELLLLHPDGASAVLPEHFSLRSGLFESIIISAPATRRDVARLARFIAGRAVGLVLAGGGARGFAHIGIIKALMEAGVPFDHLGGTSMGAIIAAGLAREWSIEELTERMRAVFVDRQSAYRTSPCR